MWKLWFLAEKSVVLLRSSGVQLGHRPVQTCLGEVKVARDFSVPPEQKPWD